MGMLNELLKTKPNYNELSDRRKKLIRKVQEETGRELLIYVSDTDFKGDQRETMITAEDRTPFIELVESVKLNSSVDIIIESPGGYIEVVEDFVHILRTRFKSIRFIIPNIAKSAGTILAMSGDEILMDYRSTLGPIDAQINVKGRSYAAQTFLEGLRKIIKEAEGKNKLERAYIPILQNISPAEIQGCEDADNLSKTLVAKWLKTYMFADLTDAESTKKSDFIADRLCAHSDWLSHGRSIRVNDLQEWGVKVLDYSQYNKLSKYIWDLWAHIFWTFRSNVIKLFESEKLNISRQQYAPVSSVPIPDVAIKKAKSVVIENKCPKCGNLEKFLLKFKDIPTQEPGVKAYPKNDRYICEKCGANIDISKIRLDMEKIKGEKALL